MNFRKSSDIIQKEMLDNIDNSYEKSKGYFLWDILKAVAIGIKNLLENLQIVADRLDVENLTGVDLERFIFQRTGLQRKEATFAEGVIEVFGNGIVTEGDLFETEGFIRFYSAETKKIIENDTVIIRAVLPGVTGNVPANSITKMPVTIPGISRCTNKEAATEGYAEESDKDLLERYYERLREPATSGNKYHYKRWAKEVPGVGDAKIFSLWNGANTVKVVIINQDRQPASEELVNSVQNYIDPSITGTGEGQAPIGAFCTVVSAKEKVINISFKPYITSGFEKNVVIENLKRILIQHFSDIAFKDDYLSYARIGASILKVEGIFDYQNLTLNGVKENIKCDDEDVMILGEVTLLE